MSIDVGKLNPGIEYQFEIITYAAACLSKQSEENGDVEDYEIFTNQDIPLFDDIIIKVKYKSQPKPFVYMGQIKRYNKPKINFNKGKEKLDNYLAKIEEIQDECNRTPFLNDLLKDIPEENIEFWYFSNSFLINPKKDLSPIDPLECPIVLNDRTLCHLKVDTQHKSIFPLRNPAACYKLTTENICGYSNIFKKFNFFLNQPEHKQIASAIVDLNPNLMSIANADDIINYVNTYLKASTTAKLTKHVFETHLLRLCLSHFIVPPTVAFEMDPQLAYIWNKLAMQYDATIVLTEAKSHIFGCLWQEIMNLFDCVFNWNESISNFKNVSKIVNVSTKFMELTEAKGHKHWLFIPDTIADLLVEMWKSNYLPLVLSSDTNVSILNKYKHLCKSFIILDNNEKFYRQISDLDIRTFANVADIYEVELGKEFLKKILISLQGREPVDIFSIVNGDTDLMKEFKCEHVLHVISEKRLFLKKQATSATNSAIFIIADDSNTTNQIDIDFRKGCENVIICKSSEVDLHTTKIRDDPTKQHCLIYNLQVNDGRLELKKGEKFNLRNFIVDENGDDLYFHNDQVLPIIGKGFANDGKNIKRFLRKPTVEPSIFNEENKIVCFLTDNFETKRWITRNQHEIIQGSIDNVEFAIEAKLKGNEHAFVVTPNNDIANIWSTLSSKKYSLLQIELENYNMLLLKHENCQNIACHISYKGLKFHEKNFFEETSTGIAVITGEPGAGKSTLLWSLFESCDKHNYVLFCNLNNYRQYLRDRNAELFENPLSFILKREIKHSNDQRSMCHNYLNFLHKFLERTQDLILFLDSFDEILPMYKKEVLDLIQVLNKPNIRLIIASRLVMSDTLVSYLQVIPIKIETLNRNDIKEYITKEKLTENQFKEYPPEFLENPMYLKFLITLYKENSLPATINKSSLYNAVIQEHIKRFYEKTQYEYLEKDILDVHKSLACVEIFDDDTIERMNLNPKHLMNECIGSGKVKLGLILRFNNHQPVFLHRTFAEFFVARWLSENIGEDYVGEIFKTLFHESNTYTKRFLDDILCANLPLHRAILAEDLTLTEKLCSEGNNYFKQVDKLNRTALHIASINCSSLDAKKQNYLILETIIKHMIREENDFHSCDYITKWKWFKYLELNKLFFLKVSVLKLTATLETYFICAEKIDEGIHRGFAGDNLDMVVVLLKRNMHLLPKYFNNFVVAALALNRLDLLCELIELQNQNNKQFNILCKACKNLLSVTEVSACVNLKIFGGFTALHIACIYGNIDVVQKLLYFGVQIDVVDKFKFKPFYYAVAQGYTEIVTCLLKHKPTLKEQKLKKRFVSELLKGDALCKQELRVLVFQPYLHISICKNYLEITKILLENGVDINQRNSEGKTALHVAVQNNRPEINLMFISYRESEYLLTAKECDVIDKIKVLLKYNTNCNIQDNYGNTPLHIAVGNNFPNTTQLLLQHGVKTCLRDKEYSLTPLELAIKTANFKILELLLEYGADSNLKNKHGNTPLHVAIKSKYPKDTDDIIKALVEAGANINQKSKTYKMNTALHMTIEIWDENLVKLLVGYGADANIENGDGHTSLLLALIYRCFYGSNNIVRVLLEESHVNVNVNHKHESGNAALHMVVQYYNPNLAELILSYGADIDIENGDGDTALCIAVKLQKIDPITMLLQRSADVHHRNKIGDTALHIATKAAEEDIVKILLDKGADRNVVNNEGQSAIAIAETLESNIILELLLNYTATTTS